MARVPVISDEEPFQHLVEAFHYHEMATVNFY
jgi:hypothetical protein